MLALINIWENKYLYFIILLYCTVTLQFLVNISLKYLLVSNTKWQEFHLSLGELVWLRLLHISVLFYTYSLPWGHVYMGLGSLYPRSLSLAMISRLYHRKQFQVVLRWRWFTFTQRPLGPHYRSHHTSSSHNSICLEILF